LCGIGNSQFAGHYENLRGISAQAGMIS
jgi:hypothetical protein